MPLNEEMPLKEEVEMKTVEEDKRSVVLENAHDHNDEDKEDGNDRKVAETKAGEGQSHEGAAKIEQKWVTPDN